MKLCEHEIPLTIVSERNGRGENTFPQHWKEDAEIPGIPQKENELTLWKQMGSKSWYIFGSNSLDITCCKKARMDAPRALRIILFPL